MDTTQLTRPPPPMFVLAPRTYPGTRPGPSPRSGSSIATAPAPSLHAPSGPTATASTLLSRVHTSFSFWFSHRPHQECRPSCPILAPGRRRSGCCPQAKGEETGTGQVHRHSGAQADQGQGHDRGKEEGRPFIRFVPSAHSRERPPTELLTLMTHGSQAWRRRWSVRWSSSPAHS
jgi:hypothetical protein